jgi:hypothetical protein
MRKISKLILFSLLPVAAAYRGALYLSTVSDAAAEKECSDTTAAFAMSTRFVKDRLKDSSTAAFPWAGDADVSTEYLGNCTHNVYGYVDVNTSSGTRRNSYHVKLQKEKGADGWNLLEIQIN